MKKVNLILIAFLVALFTACSAKQTKTFVPTSITFVTTSSIDITKYDGEIKEIGTMEDTVGNKYSYALYKNGYTIIPDLDEK